MYQALYRKYRPTNLDDVYGQDVIVQILKNSILNDKVSHAYLFCGPRGTGKTSVAKILGKILNCKDRKDYMPCEKCESCIQFNEKSNIDIIEIDAASNNGVDEIREIKNKINLVPTLGKYKIYIIDEVHMLSIGAFNALLKTLEEPPTHVIFIMATTDPHKVPPTILSRCQKLEFKKISVNDIANRIRYIIENENIKIDNDAIYEIAKHSNGGLRDAISMLDQLVAYSNNNITKKTVYEINGLIDEEYFENIIVAILEKDLQTILDYINDFDKNGKNLIKIAEELIIKLKNILVCKIINDKNIINGSDYILKNIHNIDNDLILSIIDKLNNIIYLSRNSNTNVKILMDIVFIEIFSNSVTFTQNNKNSQNEKKNNENNIIESNDIKKEKSNSEYTEEKLKNISKDSQKLTGILEKVKEIRINNTLSRFNKKLMMELSKKLDDIKNITLIPEYGYYASLLIDAKLKAASDEYLIFVFDDDTSSNLFNENIITIEKMLKKYLELDYKVISTYLDDWEKIKNEFNNKLKTYVYEKENFDLEKMFDENNDEVKKLFGDIVEYN